MSESGIAGGSACRSWAVCERTTSVSGPVSGHAILADCGWTDVSIIDWPTPPAAAMNGSEIAGGRAWRNVATGERTTSAGDPVNGQVVSANCGCAGVNLIGSSAPRAAAIDQPDPTCRSCAAGERITSVRGPVCGHVVSARRDALDVDIIDGPTPRVAAMSDWEIIGSSACRGLAVGDRTTSVNRKATPSTPFARKAMSWILGEGESEESARDNPTGKSTDVSECGNFARATGTS